MLDDIETSLDSNYQENSDEETLKRNSDGKNSEENFDKEN